MRVSTADLYISARPFRIAQRARDKRSLIKQTEQDCPARVAYLEELKLKRWADRCMSEFSDGLEKVMRDYMELARREVR